MLLPSPRTSDTNGAGHHGDGGMDLRTAVAEIPLLPTPAVNDMGAAYTPETWDEWTATMKAKHNSKSSGSSGYTTGHDGTTLTDAAVRQPAKWGDYEPAIRRWECVTRPAPEPTKLNAKGNPKLSDDFDEWLMGYPVGWITDVPGVTWNEALKACGNGVVPQQGAAAIRWLLRMSEVAA